VRARLRSDRPVAALLSGGLDSSSIVAVARRALPAGDRLPATFSMVFPDRPEADERQFIASVARHCGVASALVTPRRLDGGALRGHAAQWLDCPGFASDLAVRGLYETIRDRGHRTVLTGCGGDYLFAGSVFHYADLLREWKIVAAWRQWRADMHTDSTGWDRLAFLRAGLWPLLPIAMKRALGPLARRVSGFRGRPRWLRLDTSAMERHPDAPRGGSFATEALARDLGGSLYTLFLESGERAMADVPLEARHPFLDVRLIDFALSIPEEQRRRGTWLKFVLRRALRDDLPADVAGRRSKADFGYVIVEALESLGGAQFFDSLRIAECGWVDGAALARIYELTRRRFHHDDARYGDALPSLWIVAALELWYGAAFAGDDPGDARRGARYHVDTGNGRPQRTIVHVGRT
jgi:asparagine synthase (glutamine-hydrolysing)